jgi:hypothetical protein
VEKNSHLNYLFAFPRFSVLRNRTRNAGLEKYAFIPYSGLTKGAPDGIVKVIQDTVIDIGDGFVRLEQGGKVDYAFLILATGTSSPPPSKYPATSQPSGNQQLRAMQDRIFAAQQIAVVGGGAVGVELSGDIKSYYPEKEVVLVHSRQQLMGGFGMRLHEFAVRTLGELGVEVWLGERPGVPGVGEKRELRFKDGRVEEFDLIVSALDCLIPCATPDIRARYQQQAKPRTRPSSPPSHPPQSPNPHPASSSNPLSKSSIPSSLTFSPWATLPKPERRRWRAPPTSKARWLLRISCD